MTTQLLLVLALLLPAGAPPKECTGLVPCPACTSCSRCRHCKVEGGTCGACQHPDNTVIRIIDGDTIVVQMKGHPETIRLIGVDTPETKDPRKPVEYFGKEASQFTASLLKGQRVRLEIQTAPTSRDRYGRLLAYVFRESDNLLINKEIIRRATGTTTSNTPSIQLGWRSSGQRSGRRGRGSGDCGDPSGNPHRKRTFAACGFPAG